MSEVLESSPIVAILNIILIWLGVRVWGLKAPLVTKLTMIIPLLVIFLGLNLVEYMRIERKSYGYT